jgi:hypothetical protein
VFGGHPYARQNEEEREAYLRVGCLVGEPLLHWGPPSSSHASYMARGGGVAQQALRTTLGIIQRKVRVDNREFFFWF